MGLFDSVKKKIKESLNSANKEKNREVSFEDFLKDVSVSTTASSQASDSPALSNSQELYESALKCMGVKFAEDGELLDDPNIKEGERNLDESFRLLEQAYESGDIRAIFLLVICYTLKGNNDGKNYNKKNCRAIE